MSALKIFEQNQLSLQLIPVSIREIFILTKAPCDFFIFEDGLFRIGIHHDDQLGPKIYKSMVDQGHWKLFITEKDRQAISLMMQQELHKSARSLSIGNIQSNIAQQTNLLSINMASLLNDPMNDEILKLQFQTIKNLSSVLLANKDELKAFYEDYEKQKHYFMISHPMLSSMLLLAFLESIHMFSEKEIEMLFVTSYFKDIGMAFIPQDIFNKKELTEPDKKLIKEHTMHSVNILKNRIPLHPNYLHMIANHHCLNGHNENALESTKQDENFVIGVETIMMGLTDTIVAATTPRPYRPEMSLFQVLDMMKDPVGKQYASEFKALVYFLRRFFLK